MNIILIGMPGSGKSSIGKILSRKLSLNFLDFDDYIEDQSGKTVGNLLQELGEIDFLRLEESYGEKITLNNTVFSTSGSLPYSQKAMRHISKLGVIVYLNVDIAEIEKRFEKMKTERIIGWGEKSFMEIFKERDTIYKKSADEVYNYSGSNLEKISLDLINTLGLTPQK